MILWIWKVRRRYKVIVTYLLKTFVESHLSRWLVLFYYNHFEHFSVKLQRTRLTWNFAKITALRKVSWKSLIFLPRKPFLNEKIHWGSAVDTFLVGENALLWKPVISLIRKPFLREQIHWGNVVGTTSSWRKCPFKVFQCNVTLNR